MTTHAAEPLATQAPPISLALRSITVLGVACVLFGLVFVIEFGLLNRFHRFRPVFTVMGVMLWLGPGLSYLACAAMMRRHRHGAATTAIITAALQGIGAAMLLAFSVTVTPVTPLPIILDVAWLIALADCVRHLVRARRFLLNGAQRTRGFEPLVPFKRVLPLTDETQNPSLRGK
jgi:hypothetical protein